MRPRSEIRGEARLVYDVMPILGRPALPPFAVLDKAVRAAGAEALAVLVEPNAYHLTIGRRGDQASIVVKPERRDGSASYAPSVIVRARFEVQEEAA